MRKSLVLLIILCVCSSVVERCPDKTEALGPIPSTRTVGVQAHSHKAFRSLLLMTDNKIIKPWWRDGVIIFSKVSAYIAIPVIIASYIGKYLDKKYGTDPIIFLISVATAFILTIYLIWREMKIFQKKIAIEEKNDKKI